MLLLDPNRVFFALLGLHRELSNYVLESVHFMRVLFRQLHILAAKARRYLCLRIKAATPRYKSMLYCTIPCT